VGPGLAAAGKRCPSSLLIRREKRTFGGREKKKGPPATFQNNAKEETGDKGPLRHGGCSAS